jgi:HSP20 family molecular chaperone IbpA
MEVITMTQHLVSLRPKSLEADFQSLLEACFESPSTPRNCLPKEFCSSNFPPYNLWQDESKNLHFEFALSGYAEKNINLSYQDDNLILEVLPEEVKDRAYIMRGLKQGKILNEYFVPASKYDATKITASFKNGILFVEFPAREELKPITIILDK